MTLIDTIADAGRRLTAFVAGIIRAYAEVFFLSRMTVGFILLVGTLLNWDVGLAGLIAVASACTFAKLTKLDARTLQAGYYTYNPLLVGLSLGAHLQLSWLTALMIAVAGVMTFLLTAALVHAFRYYLNLPALSLPFVIASATAHMAVLRYSTLTPAPREIEPFLTHDYGIPLAVAGFLKAIGAVFFVPSVLVGGLFAGLLVVRSRILFLLAVGGYAVGTTLRGLLLGSWPVAYGDVMSFNFLLTAMAVGGIFLIPSWRSFLTAAAAVAVSVVLVDAVQSFGFYFAVPAYTLPFNLATLGVVYALSVNQFPGLTKYFGATPEETLENDLVRRARFDAAARPLELPVLGRWTVWQGCDDQWTHQGIWQHAYDFVIADDDGRTHAAGGTQLADFYCFRKPVAAPCRGRVVKVVDDLPDNPPGRVDKTNNWGNHVVLLDDRGFYVELSHFAYRSIKVRPGDRVEPGLVVGLCGNSGYSPQPHLHIHVQATERVGDATLPFSFVRYVDDAGRFTSDGRPKVGQTVEAMAVDESLAAATDYLLNDVLEFDELRDGVRVGLWSVTVKMALDGTLYFESCRGGKLYFGKHDGTLYCYRCDGRDPLLETIYRALPRLPLVRRPGLLWTDVVPIGLVTRGWRRAVRRLVAPFYADAARAATQHRFVSHDAIETTIAGPVPRVLHMTLDDGHGLTSVRDGRLELRAVRNEPTYEPGRMDDEREHLVIAADRRRHAVGLVEERRDGLRNVVPVGTGG